MNHETCPHCGAEKLPRVVNEFVCGTYFYKLPKIYVSETCRERQLAAKDAEIEKLRKELAEARGEK